jgi:hypothetical protein
MIECNKCDATSINVDLPKAHVSQLSEGFCASLHLPLQIEKRKTSNIQVFAGLEIQTV